ncbi:DUF4834 family protein [uncultured Maribacter sp.]|uniref:DUF4834 family protein n=1 Tax=uncultured Maribacter sp. TaxID=431308 RepID=UPI002619BE73|nr:DUF4834 family protein [uncultured Maribacter sp.]
MAFLKTILFILLFYYLFKIVAKWFAPNILRYAAKKTEAHFKEKMNDFSQQNTVKEDPIGDVIIDKKTTKKRSNSKKVGEYIDFEEVE